MHSFSGRESRAAEAVQVAILLGVPARRLMETQEPLKQTTKAVEHRCVVAVRSRSSCSSSTGTGNILQGDLWAVATQIILTKVQAGKGILLAS